MIDFSESNRIYNLLDSTSNIKLYNFDGLDIPFNPSWKKIGINLSGGADSSCLLVMLCNIIIEHNFDCEIHIITHNRCWNTRPWQSDVALSVYHKFLEKYPSIKFFRHKNYIPPELEWGSIGPITKDRNGRPRSGDQIIVASFNEFVMYKENLQAMYNATSRNPDVDFPHKMMNREKPPEEGVLTDLIFTKQKRYVILPFTFVRKDWIVAEYYRLGMEDIYNTTRSCEGDIGNSTVKESIPSLEDYKPGMYVPICNECFWCFEREWAENKLAETLKGFNE